MEDAALPVLQIQTFAERGANRSLVTTLCSVATIHCIGGEPNKAIQNNKKNFIQGERLLVRRRPSFFWRLIGDKMQTKWRLMDICCYECTLAPL